MADERRRIVITEDELPAATPPPSQPAYGPQTPTQIPGLPPVATAPAGSAARAGAPNFLRSTLGTSIVGAVVAIIPAWLALQIAYSDSPTHLVTHAAVGIGFCGAVFGAIYSGWEDAASRLWEKATQAAAIGFLLGGIAGAISGAIAQELFSHIVKNLLQNTQDVFSTYKSVDFYLARALAWAIFGLGIGIAVGLAKRSTQRAINGLVGGAAGGAVGGLVFHWISLQSGVSEGAARLLGLAVVGAAIGVAIGLVEVARRQAWLRVIAGGMTGKEFIVYHQQTNVGSSPKCQITLIKDPGVQPFHFAISEQGNKRLLSSFDGAPTFINATPVTQHWLRNGETIGVGSTALQYSEREVAS